MKKFILVFTALLVTTVAATGQTTSRWGITAGANFNEIHFKQSDIMPSKRMTGPQVGVTAEMNFSGINRMDVNAVLRMMPNKRYSTLIRLRYLEGLSNEETAEVMCMTIDNYYNKHKLAKTQFEQILRKEIHHA